MASPKRPAGSQPGSRAASQPTNRSSSMHAVIMPGTSELCAVTAKEGSNGSGRARRAVHSGDCHHAHYASHASARFAAAVLGSPPRYHRPVIVAYTGAARDGSDAIAQERTARPTGLKRKLRPASSARGKGCVHASGSRDEAASSASQGGAEPPRPPRRA